MTCIDAAIIKALVEHIGGNPDDVVGDSGSNSDVPLDITWKLENKDLGNGEQTFYIARVNKDTPIRPGAILKFRNNINVADSTYSYLCIGYEADSSNLIFTAGSVDQNIIATKFGLDELSSYYYYAFDFGTIREDFIPDQIITGVFQINTIESTRFAFRALATNTSARLNALEAKQ